MAESKLKLIILEGISGSGKTTLMHDIHAMSNYLDLVVHRFTPTNWVYDHLERRREFDYEKYNEKLQEIYDVSVIWFDCSPEIAMNRQIEKKDPRIENLREARKLFTKYFSTITSFKDIIYIQTDKLSKEACIDMIRTSIYGR
jgi:thymidylate kinase